MWQRFEECLPALLRTTISILVFKFSLPAPPNGWLEDLKMELIMRSSLIFFSTSSFQLLQTGGRKDWRLIWCRCENCFFLLRICIWYTCGIIFFVFWTWCFIMFSFQLLQTGGWKDWRWIWRSCETCNLSNSSKRVVGKIGLTHCDLYY